MKSFFLAIKNIFAHRRRNLIVLLVVSFVSMASFLILSFSDGEISNIKYGLSTFFHYNSDLLIVREGYKEAWDRSDGTFIKTTTLTDCQRIQDSLKKYSFIDEIYNFSLMITTNLYFEGQRYTHMDCRYVDVTNENYLTSRYTITYGRNIEPEDKYSILLHHSYRQNTPIREGNFLNLSGMDSFGQVFIQKVQVVGFYKPNADNPNLIRTYLCDEYTNRTVTGYYPEEYNGIAINLKKGSNVPNAITSLKNELSENTNQNLDVYTTEKLFGKVPTIYIYELFKNIFTFICLLTIGIVSIGIMNIVSVNLLDRRKEIGTYYCIGSEKSFLLRMYTLEILFVNITGALIGIFAGLGIREFINSLKLYSESIGIQVVLGGSVFTLGFSWSTVILIIAGISGISFLTAINTLNKSLNVSPVEAIRETE